MTPLRCHSCLLVSSVVVCQRYYSLQKWIIAEFDIFVGFHCSAGVFSELLPGMNSAPVGSFPELSLGFFENLVGGLLILPDQVVCSAVLLVICALLLAGALGKGLLPFSCYIEPCSCVWNFE
jgi:hypothetical protein